MLLSRRLMTMRRALNSSKYNSLRRFSHSLVSNPQRSYVIYQKPSDSDAEAAEANPIRHFYQDEVIQELTEMQRMHKIATEHEPRRFYNFENFFPQVVEDFNFNALPEPEPVKSGELEGAADIKLDQLSENEAVDIIFELNKDKFQ